jgi:hypothetical protein
MNRIHSRADWLLDSCYYNCFVCCKPFHLPPKLDGNGILMGKCLVLDLIVDEYGSKESSDERVCRECWNSDLSQFNVDQDTRFKPIFIPD